MANQYLMSAAKLAGGTITWTANGAPDYTGAQSGVNPATLTNIQLISTIAGISNIGAGVIGGGGVTGPIGPTGPAGPGSSGANIPLAAATTVATPITGKTAFFDTSNNSALSTKDTLGNIQSIQSQVVINVKDFPFGAKGNGIHDDTTAIQNAINSFSATYTPVVGSYVGGHILHFPAGTYILSSQITLPNNVPMIIQGEGEYVSQLQWSTAVSGIVLQAPFFTINHSNITIRDLQLVNAATASLGVTPVGNYWQPSTATTHWGSAGTIISLPGQSNRMLQLVTPGTTAAHVPFNGAHAYCTSNGPKIQTTIAAGSDGFSLPQGTINVASTLNMLASGTATVTTTSGPQTVAYSNITGTSLTGCSGGAGTMHTGNGVTAGAPYPVITGTATADITQLVFEVGDAGRVGNSTMDFRTSYDGGATFPTGYQFAALGGNALANGLTVTFPDANYGAPSFYNSTPMGAGFSNIVGDMITDGTAVWQVIDGTNGILLQGQGSINIERVSVQGFINAIILDTCLVVQLSSLDLGPINGLWITTGNERQNAPGTSIQVSGACNMISADGMEIFCYGIGIADSGGLGRKISNVNFESSTTNASGQASITSAYAWFYGGTDSGVYTNWTGEGAYWGVFLGGHMPFTGGMQDGINSRLLFESVLLGTGQGGFGGPGVEFGCALGGGSVGSSSELITFQRCDFNTTAYAYAVEGIGSTSGVSFDDCTLTGQTAPFDTAEGGTLFFYKASNNNTAGSGWGVNCQPVNNVDVVGSFGLHTRSITSAYVIDAGGGSDFLKDFTLFMSNGPYNITLPNPTLNKRRILTFKATDITPASYTILPFGSETIDGLPNYTLFAKNSELTLQCNGTNWLVISAYPTSFQSVPTTTYFSSTGIASTISQMQIPMSGGNIAFQGNAYLQMIGAGGCKVALSAPSGAYVVMQAQGPSGAFDTFVMTGLSAGVYGTAVGTGVYANIINVPSSLTVAGSIRCGMGCTGPVSIGFVPVLGGHTGTILPGSNMIINQST